MDGLKCTNCGKMVGHIVTNYAQKMKLCDECDSNYDWHTREWSAPQGVLGGGQQMSGRGHNQEDK